MFIYCFFFFFFFNDTATTEIYTLSLHDALPIWRMPPDSSCGRLSPKPLSRTVSSNSAVSVLRSALGTPLAHRASSTFLAAVSHGNSAGSWNISPTRRPPVSTSPDVGLSRPATRFSSVLLPQPEAPMMQTNSPSATVRETWSSASSCAWPDPYTLLTPVIPTAAVSADASVFPDAPVIPDTADAPGATAGGVTCWSLNLTS